MNTENCHVESRLQIKIGNNIDVVQNVSCHFEQSEKSRRVHWQSSCVRSLGASLCRDDTIDEILVLVDNCYIITNFIDCFAMHEIRQRLGKMQTSLILLNICLAQLRKHKYFLNIRISLGLH